MGERATSENKFDARPDRTFIVATIAEPLVAVVSSAGGVNGTNRMTGSRGVHVAIIGFKITLRSTLQQYLR